MRSRLRPHLPVRGTRVQLRAWRGEDVPIYRHWLEPGHLWARFDGPYFGLATPGDADRRAAEVLRRLEEGDDTMGGQRLVIADRDDALMGSVSTYPIDETGWRAVGIDLYDPAHWGRGLGHEALRLWVDLLFTTHPELHRLDLRTWSGNTRMMALAERLGFTQEARFREARTVDGQRYDALGYGMLRGEWTQR